MLTKTVDANASSVLRIDSQEYLPEAASMTPPVLPEQPAQELEQFYPGSKRLLTIHDAGRFDNSPVVQIQQSLQEFVPYSPEQSAAELDSDERDSTTGSESVSTRSNDDKCGDEDRAVINNGPHPPSTVESGSDEIPYGVGGVSHTTPGNTPGQCTSDVNHMSDPPCPDRGHSITISQNYAPWDEITRNHSNVGNETETTTEKIKYHCLTQGCVGRDSRLLRIHRGHIKHIGRWRFGSTIKFSIDYNSFVSNGRTKEDADYALRLFQTATEVWNCHNIGVDFKFEETNTSPVVFQLKYTPEPWGVQPHDRDGIQAMSFFPVDCVNRRLPLEVYVFRAAFNSLVRPAMTRTFLHEVAHILGGRHEDAATMERDEPSVQLGFPNNLSVLTNDRSPSSISLHWKDVKWFSDFMRFPPGHRIDGYSIVDIVP
ncbi:hypothetical protein F5B18DRAFT_409172 [Nemania serpens]|nr:hypothetical protein F5B18DRAFT_409172 [Nemania serpens]